VNCYEAVDLMGDALDGRLPEGARAGFEVHMAECGPCATYLAQIRAAREALMRLPVEPLPRERLEAIVEAYRRELGARGL